ncbi:unnamed protein product (macronuclear) [Paramecium tetraurelia]|uniref:Uncharacterized protein n=1 Tax=Paramecium tetraurelia TaxID=5888 RepID=A0C0U0_PARTE|nr:uncharacterized protein GSPATT00033883001 [Paramecium tetraurelia]CAK64407.1 unnamed protein product [Paramecium tetraurelia]|eukprot:XP_001431805.1 hypothetical protein (macronuclear) [Paramecium tetraurelia strain d4-2]
MKQTDIQYDSKCSSTKSANKDLNDQWFRTPKANQRIITLQSDNKSQTYRTLDGKQTTQPCTSFKEEFQKVSSKIGSFASPVSDFQNKMHYVQEQQMQELKVLDMQNLNVSLQQENLIFKKQIQLQQDQIQQKDIVIKKLKLTIQQLTTYNQQLQQKIDKQSNQDKQDYKKQIKLLETELADKNSKITQFSKIQDEIKSLEDFYVRILSKMKVDLLSQNRELVKLLNHVQCLNQIAIFNLQQDDLPIDLLFKYKQYALFEDEMIMDQKAEMFELTKENNNILSKIHEEIKKTFDKISYNLVDGFSVLNT